MKLIKNKKVETVTEEIEIPDGIYYFADKQDRRSVVFKIEILSCDINEGHADFKQTKIEDFSDSYGIKISEWYFEGFPNVVAEKFLKEDSYVRIEQEEYLQLKQEVLNRI